MSTPTIEKSAGGLQGAIIEGRYEVTRLLEGRGEIEIYEGRQALLDRPVVLKVLHPGAAGRSDLVERFLREGRALAKLDHPGIAHVLDVGLHDAVPYLARDTAIGPTLEALTTSGRSFSWAEARTILIELLRAVEHLHGHGLVHRDLSAANIVLTESGAPRIVECGFVQLPKANEADDAPKLTGVGMVLGDPRYAAAEHLMGFPTDARSDLYSLGVLAFRLAAGTFPFPASTPAALIALQGRPAPMLTELVQLPPEAQPFADLLAQLLAVNPDRRPRSATDALLALGVEATPVKAEAALAEPITEKAVVLPPPVWKEQLDAMIEATEDLTDRWVAKLDHRSPALMEKARALRTEGLARWKRLDRSTKNIVAGVAVGACLALVVGLSSGETEAPVVVEVVAPEAPPPDPKIQASLQEAREHAVHRRAERALDSYQRVAERAPELFDERDIRAVAGYLSRKDWLTSTAERILVRLGERSKAVLHELATDPKTSTFLRRRVEDTLRSIPEG